LRRLLLLFAVLFAWVRPLEADLPGYDDAYYARKALEVVRSGEWLALPFNGSPTFDNPPLGVWAESVSFLILGASDAAARLPSGIFGVLSVLLLHAWLRRRSRNAEIAFIGAALFLCNPLFLKYLRRGMLDVGLLFWSLAALWVAERKPLSRPMHSASGFLFGLAFLTKSAMSLAIPAAMILGWILEGWEGRRRLRAWATPALLGFASAVGPWLLLMQHHFGDAFLRGHFGWLLLEEGMRGVSDTPRLGSVLDAAVVLLPLIIFYMMALPWGVRQALQGKGGQAVPLMLAIVPIAATLILGPRKLWYFLLATPGLASVAAQGIGHWSRRNPLLRSRIINVIIWIWVAGGAAVVALPVPLHMDRTADLRAVAAELGARTGGEQLVSLIFPGESCRWNVRNSLIWYADRRIRSCSGETSELLRGGSAGREWVVTTSGGLDAIEAAGQPVLLWFRRGEFALISFEQRPTPLGPVQSDPQSLM